MCRMLAAVGPFDRAAHHVARFHREAVDGTALADHPRGHRDGWGIVKSGAYLGRSSRDAFEDPAYEDAAQRVGGAGRGAVLVHLRAASHGAVTLENTHPFVAGGLAFAHNGSVEGIAPPGENDSRAYFQAILDERQPPEAALRAVARRFAKEARYSSLTALLTDGHSLWGVRKVGDPEEGCTEDACAAYYTLAVATHGDITIVAQDTHVIPGAEWHAVPDGHVLAVRPDGSWETAPL